MITADNLAELLSAVPGAEPRLTNSRYTQIPGVSQERVCHVRECAKHMQVGMRSISVPWNNRSSDGKDLHFCLAHQGGPRRGSDI